MKRVGWGDTILLHYRLAAGVGEVVESTFEGEPAVLTLGTGELAENLERCLIGLQPGETHVFLLQPEQAFGACDPARVHRLPLAAFPPEMPVTPRALIEFALPNGSRLLGTVLERDAKTALVDFNHPLCGCPVQFEVQVLEIRAPANPEPAPR
ncbi:FKBP-type peptidyl-prolyl cis-trans isomerase [Thiobacter aerophilum]|uniref:Peptidyl-prolyl cis-trans isomerase n=1 Tax=Thiobacter aerophilum TaxID=3121275 RepID=A0ABV0EHE2_9BURK